MENTQTVLRKKLYSTMAAAALMALILGQRHAGFMLYIAIIPLAIWIPYSVFVMVRKPERRLLQLALVSSWVLAVLLVAGTHYFRHEATRRNAEEIVAAIKDFKTKRGSYPLTLDEVGIGRRRSRWDLRPRKQLSASWLKLRRRRTHQEPRRVPVALLEG